MNLLRTATLVAIFIKCATASTDDTFAPFREAVDKGSINKTVKLFKSFRGHREYYFGLLNYVVDTKDQDFIFKFAKQVGVEMDHLLVALRRKKSPTIIVEAFEVFKFDQADLTKAASELELICSPDDHFKLLGKIKERENQEKAIQVGVWNLVFYNRTECLDPLLDALDGNESFKHLKDVAVKKAFEEITLRSNKPIVECFYDDPVITSEVYAEGLTRSTHNSQKLTLTFLLREADQNDLNAAKKAQDYKIRSEEFRKAIDKALLTAKPGGSRLTHRDPQRAKLMMEAFDENPSMGIPIEISELIASYLVEKSVPEPRIRFTKLVVKILESDDSGIKMATVISQLILSYLSEESILESIATSFKQTIGIKGTQADNSADENA